MQRELAQMPGKAISTLGQLFFSTHDHRHAIPRRCTQTRQLAAGSIACPRAETQPDPEQPSTAAEKGEPYPCSEPGQKL